MALTFTARAAGELRARLRQLGAGGVPARTFHAAALAQLNHFWPLVVGGTAPRVLDYKGAAARRRPPSGCGSASTSPTLRDVAAEIEWRKVSAARHVDALRSSGVAARGAPGTLDDEQMLALIAGLRAAQGRAPHARLRGRAARDGRA